MALAIHKRLGGGEGFRLTLLQENARLVPQFPAKVAWLLQRAFEERGVTVRTDTRVIGVEAGSLLLEGGERVTFRCGSLGDQCRPAAGAEPAA